MKCLKCHEGELQVDVTSLTYSREGSAIQVQVDGIPVEVCPVCGEAYLSETVAQQIFELVNPLLQVGQRTSEKTVLSAPMVDIRYPPLAPARLRLAVAT